MMACHSASPPLEIIRCDVAAFRQMEVRRFSRRRSQRGEKLLSSKTCEGVKGEGGGRKGVIEGEGEPVKHYTNGRRSYV